MSDACSRRKHDAIYGLTSPEQMPVRALVGEVRGRLLTGLMPDALISTSTMVSTPPCIYGPRRKGDGLGQAAGTWVNGTRPAMLWAWAWERFS